MPAPGASDYQNAYMRLQQSALFAAQRQQQQQHLAAKTMLDDEAVNDLSLGRQRQSPPTTVGSASGFYKGAQYPSPGPLDTTPPSDIDTSAASNNTSPRSKRKQAQPQQISAGRRELP